jgi:hypothetical protein
MAKSSEVLPNAIRSADSWYGLACALLEIWRLRDRDHVSWRHADDEAWQRGEDSVEEASMRIAGMNPWGPVEEDRATLLELADVDLPEPDVALSLAIAIDESFWPTFTDSWIGGRIEFVLRAGDFYPVTNVPLDELPIEQLSVLVEALLGVDGGVS